MKNYTFNAKLNYTVAKIVVKKGSDCPFLVARDICLNSNLNWNIYTNKFFNIHYPDRES